MAKNNKSKGVEETPLDSSPENKVVATTEETTDAPGTNEVDITEGAETIDALKAKIAEQAEEIESLKEMLETAYEQVEAKDSIIAVQQEDLDKLSQQPNTEAILADVNPLGAIEKTEHGYVFVAPNGDCYALKKNAPERFNFRGVNKKKKDWAKDLEAMAELVAAHSPLVKLLN